MFFLLPKGERSNHRSRWQESSRRYAGIRRLGIAQHFRSGAVPDRTGAWSGKFRGRPTDPTELAGGSRKGGTGQTPTRRLPPTEYGDIRGLHPAGVGQFQRIGGPNQPNRSNRRITVWDGSRPIQRCRIAPTNIAGGNWLLFPTQPALPCPFSSITVSWLMSKQQHTLKFTWIIK